MKRQKKRKLRGRDCSSGVEMRNRVAWSYPKMLVMCYTAVSHYPDRCMSSWQKNLIVFRVVSIVLLKLIVRAIGI